MINPEDILSLRAALRQWAEEQVALSTPQWDATAVVVPLYIDAPAELRSEIAEAMLVAALGTAQEVCGLGENAHEWVCETLLAIEERKAAPV